MSQTPPAASPTQPSLAEQLPDDDIKTLRDGVSPEAMEVLTRLYPELADVFGTQDDGESADNAEPDEAPEGPPGFSRPKTALGRM